MAKFSSIVTLLKMIKTFGYSKVAAQGFSKTLRQIDEAGSDFADSGIELLSRQMKNGLIDEDFALHVFDKVLSKGNPLGPVPGGALSTAVLGLGSATTMVGAAFGFAELATLEDETNPAGDSTDLSTGIDDYRAEAQTGGKDFQYGALTMNLGGDNPSGHYDGTFGKQSITVDPETRNVFATVYDDTITSSDDVNVGNYIDGGEGNDRLEGGGGNDVLIGGKGNDTIRGGLHDDLLIGGEGADILDGGQGDDTADYSDSDAGVTVDLGAGTGTGGHAEGDTLTGIENLVGSKHDDVLIGNDADNMLIGGEGNDVLRGDAGHDLLAGGDGNDALEGGAGDDSLSGGDGADLLDGGDGSDTASYSGSAQGVVIDLHTGIAHGGDAGGDTFKSIENVTGSDHADVISGDDHDAGNVLFGGGGDDQLFGRGGHDLLEGGAGADLIDGGEGNDTAGYLGSDAGVDIDLGAGTARGGDATGDVLRDIENVAGSEHADILRGDAGSNIIGGNAGNDLIEGRDGDDLLLGGDGDDTVDGGEGNDILFGGVGNDRLVGGAGDDVLEGGYGADTIDGGEGRDTVSYAGSSNGGVHIDLGKGIVSGGHAYGDVLTSIENVIGSGHDDTLIGDAGANWLVGGAGKDTLNGGAGDDVLTGGAGGDVLDGGDGIDTADYSSSDTGVALDLSAPVVGGGDAEGDRLSGIENVSGSAHDDMLTGDAGANVLSGGAGNDRLIGGAGADTLDGGDGIDTANYDRSEAGVTIDLAAGAGKGGTAEGDTLKGIENVVGSDFADTLIGDANANRLDGGLGNDTLSGGAGDDVLAGGAGTNHLVGGEGSDTVDYTGLAGPVSVDLALGTGSVADVAADTYESIENATGTDHADYLAGNAGANRLDGGAGNDRLYGGSGDDVLAGGAGADRIDGGAGIDTADYGASDAGVRVNLAGILANGGHAEGDQLIDIENVIGSAHADTLTGNAGDNVLEGGAGADVIDGGAGIDTATYAGSKAGVGIDLGAGTATGGDAEGDKLTRVENLIGSAHADRLAGDAGANRLDGGKGDDVLVGGEGADWLDGGDGVDTADYSAARGRVVVGLNVNPVQFAEGGVGYEGEAAGDRLFNVENLIGSAYGDLLHGDDTANRIDGGRGDDHLVGAGGDDWLIGGEGADRMEGGAGIDTVDYSNATSGVIVGLNHDPSQAAYGILSGGTGYAGEAAGDRLFDIENIVGSAHDDLLHGDAGQNRIDGGKGDDRLVGSGGADTLIGGDGNDTAAYTDSAARVVVDLAAGTGAEGEAEGDTLSGIENLEGSRHDDMLLGDHRANRLVGGAGNDTLNGREGDDVLVGGEGGDWLDGGAGVDTADYSAAKGRVVVGLNVNPLHHTEGGMGYEGEASGDRLFNVENLVGSAYDDILHGDDGENRIDGGAGNDHLVGAGGNDILVGGAGADRIEGGAGIDTVDYSRSAARVNIVLGGYREGQGGDAQGDWLLGVENAIGSDHDDILVGSGEANRLEGGKGNDTLHGGKGDDWLVGGEGADLIDGGDGEIGNDNGIDTVDYTRSATGVRIQLNAGVDGVGEVFGRGSFGDAEGDTLYSVENVIGSDHADTLIGDDGDNLLDGGRGHDTLAGKSGNDRLDGGDGDDILWGDEGDDWIIGGKGADEIHGGSGTDTVDYSASDAGVTIDLEQGIAYGGHADGDTIDGMDSIIGSDFADVLNGSSLANYLQGNAGNDKLFGHAGNDALYAGDGDDRLEGGSGNDQLVGGAGNDELVGGTGDDWMAGDAGADTFVFGGKDGNWGNDHIVDFTEEDMIGIDLDAYMELDSVLANAKQDGADVVLTFEDGTITLHNTQLSTISASDFIAAT